MVDTNYKKKATEMVKLARQKGLIKKYSEFCDTDEAKERALSKEEIIYYTSMIDLKKQAKQLVFISQNKNLIKPHTEAFKEFPVSEERQKGSTNDWTKLCENCITLVKEAKMSDEDIDKIVERVKKEIV
jgi:dTDP-4-amino-4,6-dideoxygalactose transaminase